MSLLWNADLSTGDRSQYGDWEWGGAFDGTPPISDRVTVAKEIDGFKPVQGQYLMRIITAPGDQYGGSTGWRTICRMPPEKTNGGNLITRGAGYDSSYTWAQLLPSDWPGDANIWMAGAEWHQTNGGSVAPHHVIAYRDKFTVDVFGGDKNAKTTYLQKDVLAGYPKGKWIVFSERYKHGLAPNGQYELWAGIVGVDTAMKKVAEAANCGNMYSGCLNYMQLGQYRNNTGQATTRMYWGGYREYSTLQEALDWANQLLGGQGPPPPVTDPPVCSAVPVISGTPIVNGTLTCSDGTWTNSPTLAFQWQHSRDNGVTWLDLAGATSKSLALTAAVQASTVRVRVIGTNSVGSATAYSQFAGPVAAALTYTSSIVDGAVLNGDELWTVTSNDPAAKSAEFYADNVLLAKVAITGGQASYQLDLPESSTGGGFHVLDGSDAVLYRSPAIRWTVTPEPPPVPIALNLRATDQGDTLLLEWDAFPGAIGYRVIGPTTTLQLDDGILTSTVVKKEKGLFRVSAITGAADELVV